MAAEQVLAVPNITAHSHRRMYRRGLNQHPSLIHEVQARAFGLELLRTLC